MGVYIDLEVDVDNISREDWENVFCKAGEFVSKAPLVELTCKDMLGEGIYMYVKSEIQEDKYLKIDADSETYSGAESFTLYKDLDMYKKWKGRRENGRACIWREKTQEAPYHKYILATSLLIEHYLEGKAEVSGDITIEQIEESAEILRDLCEIDIAETSATKNASSANNPMRFLMSLFGVLEEEIGYDVFEDEYDMVKRLELISDCALAKLGIVVDEMSIEDLKVGILRESKRGSYIWSLETVNAIMNSDDLELLKKYYRLLSLNLFSGEAFDECDVKFFPEDEIVDLRKPKKLISKFVTHYVKD